MKKLITVVAGMALSLWLFAPSARAGSSSAVWVDTRAFVLAPELPEDAATCEVMSGRSCSGADAHIPPQAPEGIDRERGILV